MGVLRKNGAYSTINHKTLLTSVYQVLVYILIGTVTAICIRTFIGEVYLVPSSSMEGTLLKSDVIWVNKLCYGPKIPLDFSHIPFLGTLMPAQGKAVTDFIRIKGYGEIIRNDVVVFKLSTNASDPSFIKRCVALPGELIEIDNNNLIINKIPQNETNLLQFSFRTKENPSSMSKVLERKIVVESGMLNDAEVGEISCLLSTAEQHKLEKKGFRLERIAVSNKTPNVYPMRMKGIWNDYHYGPIRVPKKGMQIILNDSTINLYMDLFKGFENFDVHSDNLGNYYSLRKQVKSYILKHNYYFMMGDNRHSALDSRHFGFVPEEFIEGSVKRSLFNYKNFNQFFKKIE